MKKAKLIEEIKKLSLDPRDYIVIGSGLLGALGLREVDDIDLILAEDIFRDFEASYGWKRKDFDDGSYYLSKGILEIGLDWDSKDAEPNLIDLKRTEMVIEGVPFVNPIRLIDWKRKKGRPKDLADVMLLKEYLSK